MNRFYRFFIYVFLISLVLIFMWFVFTAVLPVMLAVAAVMAIVWGLQYGYEYLKTRFGKDHEQAAAPKVIDTTYTKK